MKHDIDDIDDIDDIADDVQPALGYSTPELIDYGRIEELTESKLFERLDAPFGYLN